MDVPESTSPGERFVAGQLVLGKYEVEGVLGEGGTGVVYSAREKSSGDEVALKVMHPHLAHEEQVRGRFAREAAILRRLEGPHVCRILESGEVENPGGGENLLCLVLPRIHGKSLDIVLQSGPIEEARATKLMREVLDALEAAHGQDIIHRDLKPHNVLVDDQGHATVVDFGLSKILNGGGTGTTNLTALNMVFGTPEYMSPEQARGDDLDHRCDLYACGVMLFQMLTGVLPFRGRTPLAVLTAHLTDEPPLPESLVEPGAISPAVSAIVLRALSKDPANRHSSAGAMRSALERAEVFPDEPDDVPERPKPKDAPAAAAMEGSERPATSPISMTGAGALARALESSAEDPIEAPPTTMRTPEHSTPRPKVKVAKKDSKDPSADLSDSDLAHSATELSLTPKPPSSRRLSDTGSRGDTGSRTRSSKPPISKKDLVPKRDHRWPIAWVVIIGACVAIGVLLGLR